MIIKKGSNQNWRAASKIELSGKGVRGLDLIVNGKEVGSSSSEVNSVLITKDGMEVKK